MGRPRGVHCEGVAIIFTFCLCLALVDARMVAFFAFGDSYVDTGNRDQAADCWKQPYGMSWPGSPAGRWSNGHLQTDKIAAALGLPTPTPYASVGDDFKQVESGINFAMGGSGVTTAYGISTLSQQIDNFNTTIARGLYSSETLAGSVALVSVAGNDYGAWNGQELHPFVETVVNFTIEGIARLNILGVRHVLIGNLPPIGCFPSATLADNYTRCMNISQELLETHNSMLENAIQGLSTRTESRVVLLDQFAGFTDAMKEFIEPFRPCCQGINRSTSCASVNSNGEIAYSVCSDPRFHFFWDGLHPTEVAWNLVVNLYLQVPGYLVHHRNITLQEYWDNLATIKTRPCNSEIGNRITQHSTDVLLR